jgi:hypothetical protein
MRAKWMNTIDERPATPTGQGLIFGRTEPVIVGKGNMSLFNLKKRKREERSRGKGGGSGEWD